MESSDSSDICFPYRARHTPRPRVMSAAPSQTLFSPQLSQPLDLRKQDLTLPTAVNGVSLETSGRSRAASNASPILNNPSTFVCNVNRTTGITPHARIGATTTIVGDVLYMFGGRLLSGKREVLSNSIHTLDLKTRHWKKIQPIGYVPRARYFHSVCVLGDEKLICFGGMALKAVADSPKLQTPQQLHDPGMPEQMIQQADLVTLSDLHIYDTNEQQWHQVKVERAPQSRYAHLATTLPSSTVWTSPQASVSAIYSKQSQSDLSLDPSGGAEMIIFGGQNMHHEYIQQLDVFNFRSLSWTKSTTTNKKYGVYRSMAATMVGLPPSLLGSGSTPPSGQKATSPMGESDVCTLIYSNYRFTDARLELDVRTPQGDIQEKQMAGETKPPGLRFPTGGIINNHLVVSGTRLHETTHEYAFWTLDLLTMTWSRLDVGTAVFSTGSWNRGLLWHRRNSFIILGDRERDLPTDYKERRVNFTNFCHIELEAFGLYANPRTSAPMSDYRSASEPVISPTHARKYSSLSSVCASTSGGRPHFNAAQELGKLAMSIREFSDMEFLSITGERVPVNSRIIAKRWGPAFNKLLRDGVVTSDGDSITVRPGIPAIDRQSMLTITPTAPRADQMSIMSNSTLVGSAASIATSTTSTIVPTPDSLSPSMRPRTLYLPHTPTTIQSLVHFLYTSTLPPTSSPLGTPQALCSLLQLARPYQIDGLFEAIVERLHLVLDERNAAAIFNAAAMAAGDGSAVNPSSETTPDTRHTPRPSTSQAIDFLHGSSSSSEKSRPPNGLSDGSSSLNGSAEALSSGASTGSRSRASSIASAAASREDLSTSRTLPLRPRDPDADPIPRSRTRRRVPDPHKSALWTGNMSGVIGIQKRGLRGLIEGRTMREGRGAGAGAAAPGSGGGTAGVVVGGTGAGIAAAVAATATAPVYARLGPSAGTGQEQAALAAAQSVGLGIVGK